MHEIRNHCYCYASLLISNNSDLWPFYYELQVVASFVARDKRNCPSGRKGRIPNVSLLSVEVNRNMRYSAPYVVHYKGANWDAAKMV